ncbi:ABC transporter permease [candidate division KSB1 bacterium]|nr:ABC transporter permease [candidate division KSB1 bacterium]
MLKNYLKIAVRNFVKHKLYSFINICGLAIGLACALFILLWVRDEISFDRFHKNANAIYRMNWDFKWNNNEGIGPGTPPPLAATLANEIPEVSAATRVFPVSKMIVRYENKFFNEPLIRGVEANFFEFFDFELLSGNSQTALAEPNSVILTDETAEKYFGNEPALGKILTIGEEKLIFGRRMYHNAFKVTGIVKSPPHNSHLQFDLLTSISSHPEVAYFDWSWFWMQVVTYAKLEPGVSVSAVEPKIPALVKKYAATAFKRVGRSYDELIASGGRWNFVFQPLTDIYLGSGQTGNRLGPVGNRVYVYIFSTIAVFILLIACINFMNLATARSANRAKEVGVRKALGSKKSMLVGQFLVESIAFSAVAMPIALFLVELFIAPFNQLSGKNLQLNLFDPPWLPAVLILLALLVGVVAGCYPGFYLSSFRPVQIFKGAVRASGKSRKLRNGLVIFQFAITIGLIVCTLLVQKQMNFFRQADMGFNKEGVVIISNDNHRLGNQTEAFKEKLKSNSRFLNASLATAVPPYYGFEDSYQAKGKGGEQIDIQLNSYMTDEDFLATLGIEIVRGRGFSKDFSTDAAGVLLNESAVKYFGWDDPLDKTLTYPGGGNKDYKVIGVMKDFNFMTLHSPITPFALFHHASKSYEIANSCVVVRIPRADLANSLELLESEWKTFAPTMPFEYKFLDEGFDEQYLAEQRLGKIFLIFSILTIFIACIGLLGLAAFATEQRTKEIGVRKVLGASVPNLVVLLSKDFSKWVLLANLIAWPVAYFAMNKWLQDFAYRIDIGWTVFALAGGLALLIALLTVSTQAIKAALANPVEALRYE